jgi:hypothetical protein
MILITRDKEIKDLLQQVEEKKNKTKVSRKVL